MIILIPIEIKVREFLPKMILIGELLKIKKKVTIYFYRGRSFLRLVKKMKDVIFFDKSLSETKIGFHKEILKKNFIISLDEEGPIYNWDQLTRKARLPKKIISKVSRIFLWGDYEKKFLTKKVKILASGHPKYDLLKKRYFNKIFLKETNYIKRYFNNYIFVSSSFMQDVEGGHENYLRYLKKAYKGKSRKKNYDQFLKYQKNDNENYMELIKLTVGLAKKYPNKTIVFRPHPSQDEDIVRSKFPKKFKNLKIIRKFQITPWINLCDIFIHAHCTTSYEAAILNKKIITLIKNKNTEHKYNSLKFKLGKYFDSADKCLNFFETKNELHKYHLPKKYIWNNDANDLASKKIRNYIEDEFKYLKPELNFDKKLLIIDNKNYMWPLASKVKNFFLKNNYLKYFDNFFELPADWFLDRDYKKKKFDKFNLNEINNFLNCILNKKTVNKLKINKISDEIIEFKKN